jgi:LysR family glycine cleavage system transcriptional activator
MPVRPPSLRSVAAFEAAARHASFTRAADELNLTTGAISHAIKSLEARLGRALFERSGRRVVLTTHGQTLLARVRLSLGLLRDAFDVAPWVARDRLIVTMLASVAKKYLVPRLGELEAALPGVVLDLRCSDALADLSSEADIAIRFGPGAWSGVESRFLGEERLFPVASPDYRGGTLPASPEALYGCDLIHHPESNWRLWLDPLGLDADRLPVSLIVDDAGLVIDAAVQGLGVALARKHLVQDELRTGRLVRLFEHDVAAEYSYWAVWNGGSAKRVVIAGFVDWMARGFSAPHN